MADAYDYLERQVDEAVNLAQAAPAAQLPAPPSSRSRDRDGAPADEPASERPRSHKSSRSEHKSSRDKSRSRSRERRRGHRSEKEEKEPRRERESSRKEESRVKEEDRPRSSRDHRGSSRGREEEEPRRHGGGGGGGGGGREEPPARGPPGRDAYAYNNNGNNNGGGGGGGFAYNNNFNNQRRPPSPSRKRERTPPEVAAQRSNEKDLRDMERSARTVFAYNLSLKAEDRDIFQLFSRAGTVLDVKLITDRSTRRSKGFAYVEYEAQEGVLAALGLTGQLLLGQPVMVKSAEAEKNLAWEVQQSAAQQQLNQANAAAAGSLLGSLGVGDGGGGAAAATNRLLISNVAVVLGEGDLQELFSPFGNVESCTLVRDPNGTPLGQAFVQYSTTAEAGLALKQMDGMNVAGQSIEIRPAPQLTMPYPFSLGALGMGGGAPAGYVPTLQLPPSLLQGMGLGPAAPPPMLSFGMPPPPMLTFPQQMAQPQPLFGGGALPGPPPMPPANMSVPDAYVGYGAQMAAATTAAASLTDAYSGSIGDLDEDEGGGNGRGGLKMNASARAALMSRLASSAGLVPPPQAVPPPVAPMGGYGVPLGAPAAAPAGPRVDPNLTLLQGMLGPSSPIPTPCLLLKNMFSAAEESGTDWDVELGGDVKEECSKHGPVLHLWVDRNSQGFVYLKFANQSSAEAAQRTLHGRYFAGRQIAAEYQFVAAYNHLFKQ